MSIYNSAGGSINFLQRASLYSGQSLTQQQIQIDDMLQRFTAGASDWRSLLAMTAGGLAYRATKVGVISLGATYELPLLARSLAPVLGLGAEVTVYRGTSQAFSSHSIPLTSHSSWLTDFVNFASLKIFGLASRNTNLILSHALQDIGMVTGHHLAYGLNLATRPEGSLLEQIFHAEMMNLQMQAGMSLMGLATGHRLSVLESSWDLRSQLSSRNVSLGAETLLLPRFAAEASDTRDQLLADIQKQRQPIQDELFRIEGLRQKIVHELGENKEAHPRYDFWMDELDHLNTRYLELAREHQMLIAMFEPKGGAEKWGEDRLQGVLKSTIRSLDRSRKFFEERPHFEEISSEAASVDSITPTNLASLRRLFARLNLPSNLDQRIFEDFNLSARAQDYFVINGLEGLHGLISRGGRDERQALISCLERVSSQRDPDFNSFHELMILAMNYQLGLVSRASVVEIVNRSNLFHMAYPQAHGPFIEIFAKMHPHISKEAPFMSQVLHFAQEKLDKGAQVTLSVHGHFGVAVMKVKEVNSDEHYYGIGAVLDVVSDPYHLSSYMDRMLTAVSTVIESARGESLPIRLYVALPQFSRNVGRPLLRSWGSEYLMQAPGRVNEKLSKAEQERMKNMTGLKSTLGLVERDLRIQQIEVAWYERPMDPEGRTMRRLEGASRERLVNTYEVINDQTITRDREIEELREKFNQGSGDVNNVRTLMSLLDKAGRHAEAIATLRDAIVRFPHKKHLKSLLRENFISDLRRLSGKEGVALTDPKLYEFLNHYFGISFDRQSLEEAFNLKHPEYYFQNLQLDVHGDGLKFALEVSNFANQKIGELDFSINYSEQKQGWVAHLSRAEVDEVHRSRGISTFALNAVFDFLKRLKVQQLTLNPAEFGPYAWLRMGADFLEERHLGMSRNGLILFSDSLQEKGLSLVFPYPDLNRLNRDQFLENLSYLRRAHLEVFNRFILEKLHSIEYYFELGDESPSYQRFKDYYALRRREIVVDEP